MLPEVTVEVIVEVLVEIILEVLAKSIVEVLVEVKAAGAVQDDGRARLALRACPKPKRCTLHGHRGLGTATAEE